MVVAVTPCDFVADCWTTPAVLKIHSWFCVQGTIVLLCWRTLWAPGASHVQGQYSACSPPTVRCLLSLVSSETSTCPRLQCPWESRASGHSWQPCLSCLLCSEVSLSGLPRSTVRPGELCFQCPPSASCVLCDSVRMTRPPRAQQSHGEPCAWPLSSTQPSCLLGL